MRRNLPNFYGISSARGFTLVEMLWVVVIIGIVLSITDFAGIGQLNTRYYSTKQQTINKNIAATLLQYAKTNTTLGTLPSPYVGGGYNNAVFDPANAQLAQIFRSANISPSEINDDGTTAQNVRVYQNVQLTQSIPMDFQSGALALLTYQYAEVHQTACNLSNATCNKTAPAIPGVSTAMTTANYKTWTTTATDLQPEFFSTLPLQKQMLSLTNSKLATVSDKITGLFLTQQTGALAGDTTNWYPFAYQSAAPLVHNPDLSGANAVTNQGCWDGWYSLNAANVNILAQLALSQSQYGNTAWGGTVQYCRDYDPALRGANSIPHFAALRINQSVSLGIAPDALVQANNIFITF